MKEKIQQIYDLLYSPIVTPQNLVENAKLKNYEYVKYYKTENSFVAEMKCRSLSGEGMIFYYHFDENNYLESVYQEQDNITILVFDRKQEEKKKREAFLESKKISNVKIS